MERLLAAILELLLPLRYLDSPQSILALLKALGYALPDDFLPPESPLDFNAAMSESLVLAVRLQTATTWEEKMAALLEAEELVRTLWDGAVSLHTSLNTAFQEVPQFINKTNFQDTFLKRLLDYLLIKFLQKKATRTASILELIGIFSMDSQVEDLENFQSECVLRNLHLERIPMLLQSPGELFTELYGWDSHFDSNLFLGQLTQLTRMFGLAGNLLPDDDPSYAVDPNAPEPERILFFPMFSGGRWPDAYWQFGLRVEAADPVGGQKKGLAIVPYADGEIGADIPLSDYLTLNLSLSAGLENGIGLFIRPPASLEVQQNLFSQPVESVNTELSLTISYSNPAEEVILLGSADQSRLALKELSLKGGISAQGGQENLFLEINLPDWSLVIDPGEGDGFIQSILAALPLALDGSLLVGYSLQDGFYIESANGLSLVIPVNKTLGPVTLLKATLSLSLEGSALEIETMITGNVNLGPFVMTVENIGLRSGLDWAAAAGLLGDLDFYFKFKAARWDRPGD